MHGQINPKIVGATLLGFALVAGTYTITNFSKPLENTQSANTQAAIPGQRTPIIVVDSNNDGIEDWRDEFVITESVFLDDDTSDYTPPDTTTGKISLGLMEGIVRSQVYGPFGETKEEVVEGTIDSLSKEVKVKLYDTKDITIMTEWDDQDIVNYANTVAATIYRHSVPDMESELLILQDIVRNGNKERMSELETIVDIYTKYRDDTLKIPVPEIYAKLHLDLINTYETILQDIEAMTLVFDDPVITLLYLKRYQEDATGLAYALQNIYLALEPKASLFTVDDPAAFFVLFSPNYQN